MRQFSREEAMEYIQEDECLEVTSKSVRMRRILLNENKRLQYAKQAGQLRPSPDIDFVCGARV